MRKGFNLVDLMVVIAILIIGLGLVGGIGGSCIRTAGGYSTGFRDGTVTKLSYKGIVHKSYEGELAMGVGVATTIWPFSVEDENVARELQAVPPMSQVRLHYRQSLSLKRDTEYAVYKIEVVTPPNAWPARHAQDSGPQPAERQ